MLNQSLKIAIVALIALHASGVQAKETCSKWKKVGIAVGYFQKNYGVRLSPHKLHHGAEKMQGANKQLPIFANEFNYKPRSCWHMRKIAEFLVLAGLIVHPFEAKANFFENCRSEKGAEKCMEIILSTYPCYLEKLDISKTFDGITKKCSSWESMRR